MSDEMIPVNQATAIAEEAARNALRAFFRFLDLDLDDHEAVRALREDLGYLRAQREGTEAVKKKINNTMWTVLPIVVIGWLAWGLGIFQEGFREAILRWLGK